MVNTFRIFFYVRKKTHTQLLSSAHPIIKTDMVLKVKPLFSVEAALPSLGHLIIFGGGGSWSLSTVTASQLPCSVTWCKASHNDKDDDNMTHLGFSTDWRAARPKKDRPDESDVVVCRHLVVVSVPPHLDDIQHTAGGAALAQIMRTDNQLH